MVDLRPLAAALAALAVLSACAPARPGDDAAGRPGPAVAPRPRPPGEQPAGDSPVPPSTALPDLPDALRGAVVGAADLGGPYGDAPLGARAVTDGLAAASQDGRGDGAAADEVVGGWVRTSRTARGEVQVRLFVLRDDAAARAAFDALAAPTDSLLTAVRATGTPGGEGAARSFTARGPELHGAVPAAVVQFVAGPVVAEAEVLGGDDPAGVADRVATAQQALLAARG